MSKTKFGILKQEQRPDTDTYTDSDWKRLSYWDT